MSTLGRNIAFPIYNGDGTSFHDLVIKKSTSDSIVMSLGDKVTGDVYYKDNTLECNMDEYIMVDGVKYSIVNPPTIVREGLKSENGDLKGMTKYSFEFYHPMYMLGNMAFSDVAVTNAESMFKSHDRTFSWIGNLTDYVAKLNKNLQNTQFVVSISSSIDTDSRKVLSDVLSFTNNTIADALKTAYDTWHFPFVVDAIKSGEQYYNQGKRFLIQFGNPTREILDSNNQPFVFHFGKGVGLKNNSRTPRNNKIVTRVAGYGSEQNIPYGYPQIPWTGDPSATQTADGYPIYEGIVGGVVTKLVKHPFTRTHLMPSVYAESVRKKVDSGASDYDNTTPLVDYYDAPSTYPNPINLDAPKLDIVGIETIKPELGDMAILGVTPLNNDLTPASGWDDTMDDDGNYLQSYFKITLPQLDFDIYACASITEEMKINMRSGACIGCTFDAQVDWDDYKKNFFDAQGNFLPNGEQRDLTKYPKSSDGSIDLIVKKDLNTYGTLMPNVYQKPSQGDKFVILGISMPSTYITNAEERLDAALMTHMLDNNVYYYDYPLKFDEDFFYNHTDILSQVRPNSVLRFTFGGVEKSLYIKQITIKYGDGVLPKYDITLTDNIEVVLNQIGLVADDVSRLAMAMMQMNKRTNINITNTESLQKYVDYTIMPNLESIQKQIDGSQVTYFGNENPFDASQPYSDGKYVVDPTKFPASEWDDDYSEHDGDMFYNRDSGKGYEFTIIDNSTSPVVYGWQLIQDEDIIQALNNAQNAQDTADGKRRVFICDASHHTPNPPYDVGDLWVNVKYPYATGATYDDEILKCVTAKTSDQAFDISDWSLANGYTAALRNFINGTYADNLREIQTQIDGKAETWYQNTDPSTAWTTTALKNQHKGDIWHNSSNTTINGVKAGQDAIWNGTAWVVDETVPQAVYDEIDGKCAIYVTWGAWGDDLQEKDLFIPAADTTQDGTTYKANKVYRCVDKDTPTFQEIAYTDDTQYNGFITKLIGSSGQTKDAAENAIAAIKHALSDGNTYNEGGLILSNLISLGTGNPLSGTFTPWAGISGIYKTSETGTGYKGHGIAAWFGGGMVDGEVSQSATNAAKSLFRFDGSGYVAGGNLSWDKNGNVTIQGYSINATTLQVGGSNVATQAMLDNFVSKAFFNRLFTAYDANGNAIVPNDTTTAINNLKIMVGAWTEQYLSALGLNSEGGGGGGVDLGDVWDSLTNQTGTTPTETTKIAVAHIPDTASTYGYLKSSALNGYATQSWVNQQGFLTTHQTLYTLSIYGGTTKVLDFKPNANASIYIKAGGDISLTNDTTNKYITLSYTHPTNGANTTISAASGKVLSAITVNSLGHVTSVSSKTLASADIPDLSSTYATASRATTLEGYFNTGGVAKVAAKLNTGTTTYTAWGQTYWSSGVPQSISGNMTSVGSITPSANGNALGTTSARFNIYGTAGNFSGNVSITGTLGVTGATTLTGLLTANGGIVVPSSKTIKIGDCTISWDSTNNMLKFDKGIYSTGAVSALGSNSSGGGSGTFDEEAMWEALGTTSTAKVIASSHIPNIAWSNITGKPSSFTPSAHNHSQIITEGDNRNVDTTPNDYQNAIKFRGLKSNSYIGSPSDDTYSYLVGLRGWSDSSGGNTHELAFNNSGIYRRHGATTTWGNWYKLLDSGNYNSYSPSLTGAGASGTWGISVSGNSASTTALKNLYNSSTRPTSANLTHITNGGVQHFKATSSMTTGKPVSDAHILHFHWDGDAYDAQMAITTAATPTIQYRTHSISGDTFVWGSWITALTSSNYSSYALPLSGGTLTGQLEVATGYGISDATGNGLLAYKPTTWGGVSSTQWGVGAGDVQGVIRSSNTDLIHYKGGSNYAILDSSNHGDYAYALYGGTDLAPTSTNKTNLNDLRDTGSYYVSTNTPSQYVTNKPDDTHNYAFRVWVSAPGGTSGYRRQRFQYLTEMTIYERFYKTDTSSWGSWYKVQGDLDGEYLRLSGGTLTGALTVPKIRINKRHSSGDTRGGIYYYDGTTDYLLIGQGSANLWIGANETVGTHHTGGTFISAGSGDAAISRLVNGSRENYIILDAGNYSSYALPLSGGTITGNLAVRGYIYLRDNNKGLYTTDTADNVQNTLYLNDANELLIGHGTAGSGYNTHIYGNNLYLRYGTSRTIGITLSSSGSTTFAGSIVAKANAFNYFTDATSYGLNMNNSDLVGVNAIYTSDTADSWTEGINFKRANGKWDSIRALNGVFYFGHDSGTENITIDAGTGKILIGGTTSSTMTYNTTNPRIVFAEKGSIQAVGIVYTDFDAYRLGKGLKVMDVDQNDPSVWFEVGGSIYATGDVQASSDARKKNIISNTKFNVKDIASARSILYEWNDGRDSGQVHGGSIAQDWIGKADSFLSQDGEGWYSINYGALALCSAITIAREVLKHSDEIDRLKQEVSYLKARVAELEERRA